MFNRDIQTPRRVWDAQRSIFDEIRGVFLADETLSRVFDISFQSKQKGRPQAINTHNLTVFNEQRRARLHRGLYTPIYIGS